MRQLLFTVDGRIARGRFWIGNLVLLAGFIALATLVSIVGAVLSTKYGDKADAPAAISLVALLLLTVAFFASAASAGICLGSKRFHDRDKPAIWVCIQFVPFVGVIWYLIEAGFLKGTIGPNSYGPDPLALQPANTSASAISSPIVPSPTDRAPQQATAGRPGWVLPLMAILTAPAAAILIGGLVTGWQTRHWLETATRVDGTVTGLTPGKSNDGSTSFKATIDAKTQEGAPIQVTDLWAISPAPKLGAKWILAYQPGHPEQAVIVGFWRQYGVAMLLDAIGGAILVGWLFITLLVGFLWPRAPRLAARPAA